MSTSKNRSLIFIIIFLMLTNIGVLGYFLWFNKPQQRNYNHRHNWMINSLQKEVGFTEEQVAQYKQLNDDHWNKINPMFEDIRKSKDSLFKLLSDESINDSVINIKAEAIAQKQKAIDIQAFNNFKRIRSLCGTPEQKIKYDTLIQRLMSKMGKSPRGEQRQEEKK